MFAPESLGKFTPSDCQAELGVVQFNPWQFNPIVIGGIHELTQDRKSAILIFAETNSDTTMIEQKTDRALPILEINDFGPIQSAKIELRPLTVLVGPSNTGKSYLAILIYALHCAIAKKYEMPYSVMRYRAESEPKADVKTDKYIGRLLEYIQSKNATKVVELGSEQLTELVQFIHSDDNSLLFEIMRSFGIKNDSDLRRKFARRKRALVRMIQPDNTYGDKPNILISELGRGCQIEIVGPSGCQLDLENIKQLLEQTTDQRILFSSYSEYVRNFRAGVARAVFGSIMPTMANRAYYLPADRTGVIHTHRAVVNALISSAPTASLLPETNVPTLSGVLSDFLRELIAIDEVFRVREEQGKVEGARATLMNVTDKIESLILNGSVVVRRTKAINYPEFLFRPDGWKSELRLMNASSMVSEMAPLILYLRHVIDEGETLIIEEPESHLHPKMQIQLTRLLALLVQAGIRVIVTTHSDWVISCLNNIVLRKRNESASGETPPIGGVGDVVEPALNESDVGVWAFSKLGKRSGSRVEQLKFSEPGHYRPDFEEDLLELHNEWATQASNSV